MDDKLSALTTRVTTVENEVKAIKVAISEIRADIEEIREQIADIMARIQSLAYVPKYSDGKATMYYTNSNGTITAGTATLDFEIQPSGIAGELIPVWQEALSAKAVYTIARAAGDFVEMPIESATAEGDILHVVVSGRNLSEDFFTNNISANVRLKISDGNSELTSEYVNMVNWTSDVIYVPDANFKTYLTSNFDENGDGEIDTDEAAKIKAIDISASLSTIKSLAGIEYLTALETLDCSHNRISDLDLSQNTALKTVNCSHNVLTSLDISNCKELTSLVCGSNRLPALTTSGSPALTTLDCQDNQLATFDVSQNKKLVSLNVNKNRLTEIDLSANILLTSLDCGSNQLTALSLIRNTALETLVCSANALPTLDVTRNSALRTLDCGSNDLKTLNVSGNKALMKLSCNDNQLVGVEVSGCTALNSFNCSSNQIATIELSKCTALASFDCSGNALTVLNLSLNSNLTTLKCDMNPSLAKLWLKDAAQQGKIAITKDSETTIFYNANGINIPDPNLKAYLVANYDDDGDGQISIAEADNVTTVNFAGKGVSDITGLESCTNLVSINCSDNSIAKIQLPTLTNLKTLTCYGNPIDVLNLSNCAALQYLYLQDVSTNAISGTAVAIDGYDQAAALSLSLANTPFTELSVTNSTGLTSLDVSQNVQLETFNCYGNTQLEQVDVSALGRLAALDVHGCKLQTLDVSRNPELTSLECSGNELTSLDVRNNLLLAHLACNGNSLSALNLQANTQLETLNVADNDLSAINVRNNVALKELNVSDNAKITVLNTSNNTQLTELYADGIGVSEINVTNNSGLTVLSAKKNADLTTIHVWSNDFLKGCRLYTKSKLTYVNREGVNITPDFMVRMDSENDFVISTTKGEGMYWRNADSYWKNLGWSLPSREQATAVYQNKTVLNEALIGAGFEDYLKSSRYWTSDSYDYIDMSDGSISSAYTTSYSYSSFGIYELTE